MPRSTLTSKGQITLPKEVRDHLGLQTGDRVNFEIRDGAVVVEPETTDIRTLRGIARRRGRPVTLEEMDAAIRKGASRR
ncbi:MAG TPA: AbrB/MazE/SpoVT family DNA-binding domain-containing protein [Thermoanaerobaculia bacterium]|nr:AbrB/MazE/SpoVT family DNA-binding domain-containing protein [Thermoanaerobaculia bacterium]